jgi:predicted DNA-binding transcriptional regulator AlpA
MAIASQISYVANPLSYRYRIERGKAMAVNVRAVGADDLMTTAEVCQMLKVCRAGLWRMTKDHGFPKGTLINRRDKRFWRSDVIRWIESRPRSAT